MGKKKGKKKDEKRLVKIAMRASEEAASEEAASEEAASEEAASDEAGVFGVRVLRKSGDETTVIGDLKDVMKEIGASDESNALIALADREVRSIIERDDDESNPEPWVDVSDLDNGIVCLMERFGGNRLRRTVVFYTVWYK